MFIQSNTEVLRVKWVGKVKQNVRFLLSSSMKKTLSEKENEDDYIFQNLTRSKEDERDKLLEDFLSKF